MPQEALPSLEEACALRPDGLYLAWMGWCLLLSSASQSFLRRPATQQRAQRCCREALEAAPDLLLALRCLANLGEAERAARAAEVDPLSGLPSFAKQLLEGSKVQRRTGAEALRKVLAEVSVDEEAQASACAVLQSLSLDRPPNLPEKPVAKEGMARRAISSKLLALEVLWLRPQHAEVSGKGSVWGPKDLLSYVHSRGVTSFIATSDPPGLPRPFCRSTTHY